MRKFFAILAAIAAAAIVTAVGAWVLWILGSSWPRVTTAVVTTLYVAGYGTLAVSRSARQGFLISLAVQGLRNKWGVMYHSLTWMWMAALLVAINIKDVGLYVWAYVIGAGLFLAWGIGRFISLYRATSGFCCYDIVVADMPADDPA